MKTKKKNISSVLIFGILVVVAGGLLVWGSGSPAGAGSVRSYGVTETSFGADTPSYDFGDVSMKEGNVSRDFTVMNDTGSTLEIGKVETSCMCTEAFLLFPDGDEKGPFGMPGHGLSPRVGKMVGPGESFVVRAVFDPAAHGPAGIGRIAREIAIETSSGMKTVQFSATVTP